MTNTADLCPGRDSLCQIKSAADDYRGGIVEGDRHVLNVGTLVLWPGLPHRRSIPDVSGFWEALRMFEVSVRVGAR